MWHKIGELIAKGNLKTEVRAEGDAAQLGQRPWGHKSILDWQLEPWRLQEVGSQGTVPPF